MPKNILIVDDERLNRMVLRAQLEAKPYVVLEAENGEEALATLDRNHVDVIITDILMPVMDGYRLCQAVRSSERHRETALIIYTATYGSPADERFSLALGADTYLRKPVPIDIMIAAIEKALESPRRAPTTTFGADDVLGQYSELLVAKLEKKNIELAEVVERLTLQATALETTADAILITDIDGVILWVNRAFTTTTGYTATEAIGHTPRLLKSGEHDEAFYREFWETILDGRTWRSEFANRRKDGTLCYDEHTVTPVLAADGSISHFVGVMHDITDRRRAEDQLREANARLQDILDHSPAVLYSMRVEGETIVPRLVSENITHLLGFQTSEALSFGWWSEHLHPDDCARAKATVSETLREGSSRTEYRVRHKDGTWRWVDDSKRLVRDAEAGTMDVVGVWTDITDRKRAEDQLQESERRFRDMLENLDLVSVMLDLDGRLTWCNDYFLRLTGWKLEEIIGRDWFQLFTPPEQADDFRELFASLISGRPEMGHHTSEILTRSRERRILHWNNSLLHTPSGDVIGTASIAEDITDRRNLEKQILRTQRLESLGTLAGGIAHDLNNVLMPIFMGATLLRQFETDERSLKAIDNIESSARRGRDLIQQVLLFARGADTSWDTVRLGTIIAEIESIAVSTFPRNISLQVTVATDLHLVLGDATQLTQVLLNLCVNARDAMPLGGTISISAENTTVSAAYAQVYGGEIGGNCVALEVTDTGEGMSRDVIDRIFDPFFTTKDVSKGTGLGLSTAMGIVGRHGGFLSVASEVGEGSTFRLYLPAAPTEIQSEVVPEDSEVPRGNGELILVVDDDPTVVSITTQALESFGYRVVTCEDGAEAIGVFSRDHADIALVLTDVAMPIIDGPALIAALDRIDPSVPIIVSTGNTSAARVADIADSVKVLAKPYSANHLLNAVAEALGSGRLGRDKGPFRVPLSCVRI